MTTTTTATRAGASSRAVVALCFLVLVLEGYDLLMYGTVVPSLLTYGPWGLDAPGVGVLGSLAGLGMLIGALVAAGLGDRVGRRRTIIASVVTFSVAMTGCALAPNAELFGLFRLLVGAGAGALMPTAVAILVEFSPPRRRTLTTALGFAGVGVGGMLAGLLALWLVPTFGFRSMFAAGAIPLVVVLPLVLRHLPESPAYLLASGRRDQAREVAQQHGIAVLETPASAEVSAKTGLRALFTDGRGVPTVVFWVATFMCLLVLFGTASWLPALMTAAGYGLTSALSFVLILNGGAVAGSLAASALADWWGIKPVTAASFMVAAIAIALLSTAPPVWAVYILVAAAGFGTTGTQILLNTLVATYYPASIRTTGLGIALGVGRVGAILGPTYGGLLAAANLELSLQFYAFALPAALGGLAAAAVPMHRAALATASDESALVGGH